jgi:Cdc6-like AAA superfamily ATPase
MVNNNWDLITDDMWRNVGIQIGYQFTKWVFAETSITRTMNDILNDSKANQLVSSIIGNEGIGKTAMLKYFSTLKNVYLVRCSEYWNRKQFVIEVMRAIGKDCEGKSINTMMQEIIFFLKKQVDPILMIDEPDKISDQLLYFFITLYNDLEDYCSIITTATPYFEKRLKSGVEANRKGYRELWSRFGKKHIYLSGLTAEDITSVCVANYITKESIISKIIQDSEGDMRRVKKKGLAYKRSIKTSIKE